MQKRLLLVIAAMIALLASAGCARAPSADSVSRNQPPTITSPEGHGRQYDDWPVYLWFDAF